MGMMMSRIEYRTFRLIATTVMFVFGVVYTAAAVTDDIQQIEILKRKHEANESLITQKKDTLNRTFNELTTLSQKINRLKEEQLKSYSILRELRLKYLLADAEKIQNNYTNEHAALIEMTTENERYERDIVARYKKRLDQFLDRMKKITNKNTKEFVELFNQYLKMVKEEESYEKRYFPKEDQRAMPTQTSMKAVDSEQELQVKMDMLISMQDRLKKNITKMERDLKSLYEKKQLVSQLKQFEDEISFFSDEFFIANATKPTKSETPQPLATETPSGDSATPSPDGGATPEPVSGATDEPTTDTTLDDDTTSQTADDDSAVDATGNADTSGSDNTTTVHTETGSRDGLLTPYKSDIDTAQGSKTETNLKQRIERLLNEKRTAEAELHEVIEKIRLLEIEKKREVHKKK